MKATTITIGGAAAAIALLTVSCGGNSGASVRTADSLFDEAPVVAEKRVVNGDTVTVVSLKQKPEPARINASDLFDDLRLVRLETSDEAMVGGGKIWVSPTRIVCYDGNVVKQFDHDGRYIGRIGAKGQGPGEYAIAPYDVKVSEETGRIYLLQYNASSLMAYDLEGRFVGNVPLAYNTPKGFLEVNAKDSTITVAAMPFRDNVTPVVWRQDLSGNVLEAVERPDLAMLPDFSSEVNESGTASGDGFGYSLFDIEGRVDSLYVYGPDGRLRPEFTVDFGAEPPLHDYRATPRYFIITTFGEPKNVTESSYILPARTPFVVDRSSLRGAPVELILDNLGGIVLSSEWQFSVGKDVFAISCDPGDLLERLENSDGDNRELIESISPDDNNYVLIGRLKR